MKIHKNAKNSLSTKTENIVTSKIEQYLECLEKIMTLVETMTQEELDEAEEKLTVIYGILDYDEDIDNEAFERAFAGAIPLDTFQGTIENEDTEEFEKAFAGERQPFLEWRWRVKEEVEDFVQAHLFDLLNVTREAFEKEFPGGKVEYDTYSATTNFILGDIKVAISDLERDQIKYTGVTNKDLQAFDRTLSDNEIFTLYLEQLKNFTVDADSPYDKLTEEYWNILTKEAKIKRISTFIKNRCSTNGTTPFKMAEISEAFSRAFPGGKVEYDTYSATTNFIVGDITVGQTYKVLSPVAPMNVSMSSPKSNNTGVITGSGQANLQVGKISPGVSVTEVN